MSTEYRFCKDCKFCIEYEDEEKRYTLARCVAPQNMKLDLVSGEKKKPILAYCENVRIHTDCGINGNWFEPKQV